MSRRHDFCRLLAAKTHRAYGVPFRALIVTRDGDGYRVSGLGRTVAVAHQCCKYMARAAALDSHAAKPRGATPRDAVAKNSARRRIERMAGGAL